MRDNKVFWVFLVVVVAIIIAISQFASKGAKTTKQVPETTELSPVDSWKEEYERERALEDTIKATDYTDVLKEFLSEYFVRIDAITDISISKTWGDNNGKWSENEVEKVNDVFMYPLDIRGYVYGKPSHLPKTVSKGGKYYLFVIEGIVAENQIKSPSLDKNSVCISAQPHAEDVFQFIYYKGENVDSINNAHAEYVKRKEAEKNREDDTKFKVDGIRVVYDKIDGASYIYKSDQQLTPKQIIKAIDKIGPNGMNMIQFNIGSTHYADYVYSTQCIIYKSSHDIYKVVNGKPVRAN